MWTFLWVGALGFEYNCTQPTLKVKYSAADVNCGNELTPTQTASSPVAIEYPEAEDQTLYSLIMVDPDAPSAADPSLSPIRHFVVVNVSQAALKSGVLDGEILSDYIGPAPPIATQLHRYALVLWKQPVDVVFDPIKDSILKWDFESWAAQYGLTHVATNLFVAKWHDTFDYKCGGEAPKVRFEKEITCAQALTPVQTASKPVVTLPLALSDAVYTIIMVDPDAPSAQDPSLSPIRHWAHTSIPGTDLATGVLGGKSLQDYFGPAPPIRTDLHRYTVIIYKNDDTEPSLPDEKFLNWDFQAWAKQYNLTFVAHTYFNAKWIDQFNYTCRGGVEIRLTEAVKCADAAPLADTTKAPNVSFPAAVDGSKYVITMVDPDAGAYSPYRHWVVADVPGSLLKHGVTTGAGRDLSPFVKPSPPENSGYHRYSISVWLQGANPPAALTDSSAMFDAQAWAAANGLTFQGTAYFRTQALPAAVDEYLPAWAIALLVLAFVFTAALLALLWWKARKDERSGYFQRPLDD